MGQDARGSRHILHNYRLADSTRYAVRQQPRHQVGGSAGPSWHHQLDRPVGPILGARLGDEQEKAEPRAKKNLHGVPPSLAHRVGKAPATLISKQMLNRGAVPTRSQNTPSGITRGHGAHTSSGYSGGAVAMRAFA